MKINFRFEGRTWYTPIRGRLWIHATKKVPTQDHLDQVKAVYRNIVGEGVYKNFEC